MARTKQSSRKATGGPAKRAGWPKLKELTGHAGTKAIKTVYTTSTRMTRSTSLPHAKLTRKPCSHNTVSVVQFFVLHSVAQTPISIVVFAGMVAICMAAHIAHGRCATVVLLFRRSSGLVSKRATSTLRVPGAMRCAESGMMVSGHILYVDFTCHISQILNTLLFCN
jgi:hypothetical protein